MSERAPYTTSPRIVLLGPYPPPSGGVASFLQSLRHSLGPGGCDWYGYSDVPFTNGRTEVTVLSDYNPGAYLLHCSDSQVVVDSASLFLEYLHVRLLWHWLFALMVRRVRWIKVIHDSNAPERFRSFGALRRLHARVASFFVWRYVAVNEELAGWLVKEIASPSKVVTIPSLLDAGVRDNREIATAEVRQMAESYDQLVCAVGALNPDYGFQHVAAAVERLARSSERRVGLLFLCTDFSGTESFVEELRRLVPELVILRNLPREEVLSIFHLCDVVVRSVRRESYGLSRIEAICQGTPVVATRTGEMRGMLGYEFGDIDGLMKQIDAAMSVEARRNAEDWAQVFEGEAFTNSQRLRALLDKAGKR